VRQQANDQLTTWLGITSCIKEKLLKERLNWQQFVTNHPFPSLNVCLRNLHECTVRDVELFVCDGDEFHYASRMSSQRSLRNQPQQLHTKRFTLWMAITHQLRLKTQCFGRQGSNACSAPRAERHAMRVFVIEYGVGRYRRLVSVNVPLAHPQPVSPMPLMLAFASCGAAMFHDQAPQIFQNKNSRKSILAGA
jgi:hypothetical protein